MAKKKRGSKKRTGGSMSKMRGGFKGAFKTGKSGKADPRQFVYIIGALFLIFALVFFFSR